MRPHRLLSTAAALALAAAATTANAAAVLTSALLTNGGALTTGEVMLLDFEGSSPENSLLSGADIVSGGDAGFYTGSTPGWAATPLGNTSQYLAIFGSGPTGRGEVTIDFGLQASSFSIDVGSIDTYNTFSVIFYNAGTGGSWTGAEMAADFGNWTSDLSNRRLTFVAQGAERFTGVKLISTQNSLEVDNLAVNAVPEPATWALMMLGFGLVGAAARRRSAGPRAVTA